MLLPASLQRKRKRQEVSRAFPANAEAGPSSVAGSSHELRREQSAAEAGSDEGIAAQLTASQPKKAGKQPANVEAVPEWQRWYVDEHIKRQVIRRWLFTSLLAIEQGDGARQENIKGKGKLTEACAADEEGWTPLSELLGSNSHSDTLSDAAESPWLRSTSNRILGKLSQREAVEAIRSIRESPANQDKLATASTSNRRKRKIRIGAEEAADQATDESSTTEALFELRLSVVDPVFKQGTEVLDERASGGWDIRIARSGPLSKNLGNASEAEADAGLAERSVYLENIPPTFENLEGLFYLLPNLVPKLDRPGAIQRVRPAVSPANMKSSSYGSNSQGDLRKTKPDFTRVIVTLESSKQAKRLVRALPWRSDDGPPLIAGTESGPSAEKDADRELWNVIRATQTRAMSMSDFEQLAEEYRTYKRQTDEIVKRHFGSSHQADPDESAPPERPPRRNGASVDHGHQSSNAQYNATPQFPHGCLIFLRNLPLNTNKTELKALCNAHLAPDHQVDYVDWQKGTDVAHVRCATAEDSSSVVSGLSLKSSPEGVIAELVEGMREEIYWMALPERIREAAMNKS